MTHEALALKAHRFAQTLTETVRAVAVDCAEFDATALPESSVIAVRQQPESGILLYVGSKPILVLKARYWCRIGAVDGHLKVDHSDFKVFPAGQERPLPLVRYDFVESPIGAQPAAHIQFHATHDQLERVMAGAGRSTQRGRRVAEASARGARPDTARLHFPVGGRRFRPCLEDVLEMLIDEFGVEHRPEAKAALRAGRERWRKIQVAAAVNDCPESAAAELERLGYTVIAPVEPSRPLDRPSRMHEI